LSRIGAKTDAMELHRHQCSGQLGVTPNDTMWQIKNGKSDSTPHHILKDNVTINTKKHKIGRLWGEYGAIPDIILGRPERSSG
jgi:hypothetical protein